MVPPCNLISPLMYVVLTLTVLAFKSQITLSVLMALWWVINHREAQVWWDINICLSHNDTERFYDITKLYILIFLSTTIIHSMCHWSFTRITSIIKLFDVITLFCVSLWTNMHQNIMKLRHPPLGRIYCALYF